MAITTLPAINLGGQLPKQASGERFLDTLSATLLEPTTFIKSPSKAADLVKERRKKIIAGDKSAFYDVIGETLTATGYGVAGTLALGTAGGGAVATNIAKALIPNTLRKVAVTSTIGGILATSQVARNKALQILQDPTKIGRESGLLIDKAVAGESLGGVTDALKKAGIIGGAIVGGAGLVAGAKALKDKITNLRAKSPSQVPTSNALPNTLSPVMNSPLSSTGLPSAPVIATAEEEKSTPSPPSVVVNNNIKINNSSKSSANRRFINNVLL